MPPLLNCSQLMSTRREMTLCDLQELDGLEMETTNELFIRCLDKGSQEGAEALDFSFLL